MTVANKNIVPVLLAEIKNHPKGITARELAMKINSSNRSRAFTGLRVGCILKCLDGLDYDKQKGWRTK